MKRYAARDGTSGVVAYETFTDAIAVRFQDKRIYLYTRASVGNLHLGRMQVAAADGRGLATYISRHVHDAYAAVFDDEAALDAASR